MNKGKEQPEGPAMGLELKDAGVATTTETEAGKKEQTPKVSAPEAATAPNPPELEEWNRQVRRRMRRQSRRSFLLWGAGLAAGAGAFEWLTTRPETGDVPWPFRKTLELNESI